jgi:hypothetical protein
MEIKTVNRTIHPDIHKSENSYRVKIGKRNFYDKLIVNIHHENTRFVGTYIFEGKDIASYESIHFKTEEIEGKIKIHWIQDIKYTIL